MSVKLKWGDLDDLQAHVDMYFALCKSDQIPPSPAGLCLHVGITRETWYYYASGRYMRHTPSYVAAKLPDDEIIDDPPSEDDLAAVDTMDWSPKLEITGDGGKPQEWSEDQRLRRGVGDILKRAALQMEVDAITEGYKLQRLRVTPVFSMFMLKASHGYKEDAPQLAAPDSAPAEDRFQLTITGSIPLLLDAAPAAKPASVSSDSGEH